MLNVVKKIFSILPLILLICPSVGLGQEIKVGENVHVSKANPERAHYEVHLSADPTDPSKLVGASMMWNKEDNKYEVVSYSSFDSGNSWTPSFTSDINSSTFDPAVEHGPGEQVYMTMLGSYMHLYKSTDEGKSWQEPLKLRPVDREYITVDNTGGEYQGRIYISGSRSLRKINGGRVSALHVMYSEDEGKRFSGPYSHITSEDSYIYPVGNDVILSDGTYIKLFGHFSETDKIRPEEIPSEPNGELQVIRSKNGGWTFGTAEKVADWYSFEGHSTGTVPVMAVDKSEGAFQDRIYVAWTDFRLGHGEILLAYSEDKGKSWSSPVVVNDDLSPFKKGEGPDHFMPTLAVNDKGVVGVMWYDRRNRPNNTGWEVRFAASLDGGKTFQPSVKVSEAPFEYDLSKELVFMERSSGGRHPQGEDLQANIGVQRLNSTGGHTAGLASDAEGGFHPFWIDNRTGVPQVWTAEITVQGRAIPHGSAELQKLTDLTASTTLKMSNLKFNKKSRKGSVEISLKNTSEDILNLPLKARVLNLGSQLGHPELLEKDNKSEGTIIDFNSKIEGNSLQPGTATKPKTVSFHLRNFRGLDNLEDVERMHGGYSIINLDMRVFGKVKH